MSALGSDTTGLGTSDDPYATIQFAAQQIRKTGYNVTATISVIDTSSSLAFLTISNSIVDVDTGPYGKQQYPLIIQGVSATGGFGRVTVQNDTVSASTPPPDSPSGCVAHHSERDDRPGPDCFTRELARHVRRRCGQL